MKSFTLVIGGLLAVLFAGGAAAQFNTEALKKMQKEGHKIVEEQQATETGKAVEDSKAAGNAQAAGTAKAATTPVERRAYRFGANLCLDARGGLSVETCVAGKASQQWALDAGSRLVAQNGRCLDGASLVKCAGGNTQKWMHDKRGRLRNQAKQCLQVRADEPGAPVTVAPCSGAPTQVWLAIGPAA